MNASNNNASRCGCLPNHPATPDLLGTSMRANNRLDVMLTTQEKAELLTVISDGMPVSSHSELSAWLQGPVQKHFPHEAMISARGDFADSHLTIDVISAIPARPSEWKWGCKSPGHCAVNRVLRSLFLRWSINGPQAFVVAARELLPTYECDCRLTSGMKATQSVVVHGLRDQQGSDDRLYLTLLSNSKQHSEQRIKYVANFLMPHVDVALRNLSALPNTGMMPLRTTNGEQLALTLREREIVDWIGKGKINKQIADVLNISTFTVKNHLRRIFRKLGAANRADAVVRYQQLCR